MFGSIRQVVEAQLETMSPRDKKLLIGLVLFMALFGAGVLFMFERSTLASKASSVKAQKDRLVMMQEMKAEYDQAAAQIQSQEGRLRGYSAQPMTAYLESVAAQVGVADDGLKTVQPQGEEMVGQFKQVKYRVELKGQTYETAVRFVNAVETNDYPIKIELARFKSKTYRGNKVVDLSLDVIAYTVAGS